jgi:molybdenum cofactor cytidylyltransferase
MPDRRPVVAAVVLAAGASTRMGRNKLLLELAGESLVRRAVRAALEAGVERVVVVLGHDEPRVRAELEGLPCAMVVNPDHARGVGTSVHTGVRHASADADAIVIVLADMPFVTSAMIAGLVERHRATGAPVVVSHYGDVQPNGTLVAAVQAPPTLYDRALFAELLSVDDERCAKQVVRRHAGEAQVVAWPESALQDVDVPADYDGVRAHLARG